MVVTIALNVITEATIRFPKSDYDNKDSIKEILEHYTFMKIKSIEEENDNWSANVIIKMNELIPLKNTNTLLDSLEAMGLSVDWSVKEIMLD
jgi:hypothetical protein